MRGMRLPVACVVILLLAATAADAQSAVTIPVHEGAGRGASVLLLEGFVYSPKGVGRFPLVVFSHGASGGEPHRSEPATEMADYFVKRGFAVVVAMRRGRGQSEGVSLESEDRNCDPASWEPGLDAAMRDLSATIEFAWRLPFVDSSRTILAGASRGGFLSVAYAAHGQHHARVLGVVNFVGAWVAQSEDRCPSDFNYLSFKRFGQEARTPMLWLYGDNDQLNSTASIQSYAKVFSSGGGKVRFVLFPNVPENGHWLPRHPELWRSTTDAFLVALAR
jgi:dienelactone hydrolase